VRGKKREKSTVGQYNNYSMLTTDQRVFRTAYNSVKRGRPFLDMEAEIEIEVSVQDGLQY